MALGRPFLAATVLALLCVVAVPAAHAGPANARLTNDDSAYVSDYTLVTGTASRTTC
jgi:hypothetical protein